MTQYPDLGVLTTAVLNASGTPPRGQQPIDFTGDWDSITVLPAQVTYVPQGFNVYLTEAQIDEIIERRRRVRAAPGYERPDVPYFHACEEEPGVLVRRLNGIVQRGRMSLFGQWEPLT